MIKFSRFFVYSFTVQSVMKQSVVHVAVIIGSPGHSLDISVVVMQAAALVDADACLHCSR